ncbi:ferrochelatase [Brevundimonas sp. 2R-24]|uniref:Ferrochelatase n=1 Tax=Peiella sedimenti TaxID=3061083 RepID=A0ABT8SMP1_9CAUL|nr:ferrochelatase [Caulobacteraceae bacterium XZ-24]
MRLAVVLFNLGGPDGPEAVRPFLFNLFNDPAIIRLPGLLRTPLARLISSRREKAAQANYALMGGRSPIVPETEAQAAALTAALKTALPEAETRVFIAMRYWTPMVEEVAAEVAAWRADEIVLLPLYPQFSTTTTASSLKAWRKSYGGTARTSTVCCYPAGRGWIDSQARLITEALAGSDRPLRVLFSAHGVPKSVIDGGDPYQAQVEMTAAAVAARAGLSDWTICYQSRVGPMKWLEPSTIDALKTAARDRVGVAVVPIAFVSEHIETLVELDIEYAELAHELGLPAYVRVPAAGVQPDFIGGLAEAVIAARRAGGTAPCGPGCAPGFAACPRSEASSDQGLTS